jgi:hypothetical protein
MLPVSTSEATDDKPALRDGLDSVDSLHTRSYERHEEINSQGVISIRSGVDVEKAEEDFSELNKQFSNISHQARRLSRHASRASKPTATAEDVEKAASSTDSDESWDLETALRGNRAAEEEAGIKDKHIGESNSLSKHHQSNILWQVSSGTTSRSVEWAARRPSLRPFQMP